MTGARERQQGYSRDELIELRKMRQAFRRGRTIASDTQDRIARHGLQHTIEAVNREADLVRKHKSSAEVVLSFMVGITVGSIEAAQRFMFPNRIDVFAGPSDPKNNQE